MTRAEQPTPQAQLSAFGIDLATIRQLVQTGHREDQVRALLQRFGALRRQDLAYLCQVNTTTAGRAVRTLLDQGLVREEQLALPGHRRTSWLVWYRCTTPTDDQLTGLVHAVPLICQLLYPDEGAAPAAGPAPTAGIISAPELAQTMGKTVGDGGESQRQAAGVSNTSLNGDPSADSDPPPHTQPTDPLPVVPAPPVAPTPVVAPPVVPDALHVPISRTLPRRLQREGIPRMVPTTAANQPTPRQGTRPRFRRCPSHWGLVGFVTFWLVLLLTQLSLPAWLWPLHADAPSTIQDQMPPPAQRRSTPVTAPRPTRTAPRTGIVTGTGDQGLIVRDAAGARIGHLAEGTVVTIQDDPVTRPDPQHPQWWPIQFHDRTGYISTEYVILEAFLP